MTKETSYTFDVLGTWHLFNSINLGFIDFNASFRNFMPQDNAFINHKVALFPIQDKISFFTSLQNSIKVDQAKTTFTCPFGTFAYRRMPFGLCNAPATFQRCMMAIFSDFCEKFVRFSWMISPFMDPLLMIASATLIEFCRDVRTLVSS